MDEKIIVLDAMGGDHAPKATVEGAVLAVNEFQNMSFRIILSGREDEMKRELSLYQYDTERISILHADEVIASDEVPTTAIRRKKNSSLVLGLRLVKDGGAHAMISAGNTGALLAGGTLIIGRLKGIERPGLATTLPSKNGFVFMLDSGANVDCKPEYLVQFAKMGVVYCESIFHMQSPTVALVNIGAEKEKGNTLSKEAYGLLEQADVNFIGNIEARDIPYNKANIIVCDGFVGNVILKFAEGLSFALLEVIKEEITSTFIAKMAAVVLKNSFRNIKKRFDYAEHGGAPLLGLQSLVVKAHGSSDAKAIKNAIRQCYHFIHNDTISKIENKL